MSQYSSPKIWGPHFWFMLRCFANNYPINPSSADRTHVKTFFSELQFMLPCEVCRYTYRQHINKNPIEKSVGSKSELMNWVEHIYQETKRVITDKRVKIMDIYEEDDVLRPIKKVYKTTQDFANKPMRSVLHREVILPAPNVIGSSVPRNIINRPKVNKKIMRARTQKKIYRLSSPKSDNFDIVNSGKKIDVQAIKNQRNVIVLNQNQKQRKQVTSEYMNEHAKQSSGPRAIQNTKPFQVKKVISTEIKLPKPIRNNAIPLSLNLPIPKNNKSITSQKSKQAPVRHVNPKYTYPIINNRNMNVNVYHRELTVKKCKKCDGY
jgi:hypothetical protein